MWLRSKRSHAVEAEIRYLRDAAVRPKIDADDAARSVLPLSTHRVRFHDLRDVDDEPSFDREGFRLLPHRSAVTDLGDPRNHPAYCTEVETMLRGLTGSALVFVSPVVVLRSTSHAAYGEGVIADPVASVVHSDRTDRSIRSEARAALRSHGIEAMPEGRLVAYNVWRALTPPPQDYPLALCDLRTIREERLVRTDSVGNAANAGESLEFYLSLHDPGHRWCYFSDQTRDEVLVFQQFDTAAHGPSGCLHTAFRNPDCTVPLATRLSVEARGYVFFPS